MTTRSSSRRQRNSHSTRSHRSFGSNRDAVTCSNSFFIGGFLCFSATVLAAFACMGFHIYNQAVSNEELSKRIVWLKEEAATRTNTHKDQNNQLVVKELEAGIKQWKRKADKLVKDIEDATMSAKKQEEAVTTLKNEINTLKKVSEGGKAQVKRLNEKIADIKEKDR